MASKKATKKKPTKAASKKPKAAQPAEDAAPAKPDRKKPGPKIGSLPKGIKNAPQLDMREEVIDDPNAVGAMRRLILANIGLVSIRDKVREVAIAKKERADAMAQLIEALPVSKVAKLLRIDDHQIELIPGDKPKPISFERKSNARVKFIDQEQEGFGDDEE